MSNLQQPSMLGEKIDYPQQYAPELLQAIPRRRASHLQKLSFTGADVWTAYELSWLLPGGKPAIAIGELQLPCNSEYLVESKSFKLYLNSLNQHTFADQQQVINTIRQDLAQSLGTAVTFKLHNIHNDKLFCISLPEGECIDDQDIGIIISSPARTTFLQIRDTEPVAECLYSNLFKSNCPFTGQPDWATLVIHYQGAAWNQAGLLKYLISYRQHQAFHENCVEQIFSDLYTCLNPKKLTVIARFLRRGGLDINPWRTNDPDFIYQNRRLIRQ